MYWVGALSVTAAVDVWQKVLKHVMFAVRDSAEQAALSLATLAS